MKSLLYTTVAALRNSTRAFLKGFAVIAAILWFTYTAGAQSLCDPTASLLKVYEKDVKFLALMRMYEIKSPDTAQIAIPAKYTDTIWRGLAAIANSIGVDPVVDTIFKKYCIHKYPYGYFGSQELTVFVDPNEPWVNNWKNVITTTGYTALDDFTSKYHLTVTYYSSTMNVAILSASDFLNAEAAARELEKFNGIFKVETGFYAGDGHTISYTKSADQLFTFSLRWGDCPAGCTSDLSWTYKVDGQCNVTLVSRVEAGSDPFPVPVNCGFDPTYIPPIKNGRSFSLFPNPAGDQVTISLINNNNKAAFSYSLYDVSGRVIAAGSGEGSALVNTGNLAPGMYIIRVWDEIGHSSMQKFCKQ